MESQLAKQERAIFNKYVEDLSFPIATSIRSKLKGDTLKELGVTEEDLDGDPGLQESYLLSLDSFTRGAAFFLKHNPLSPAGSNNKQSGNKRERPLKTYDRRIYMVNFIFEWRVNNTDRINWEKVTAEWNEANPSDRMSSSTLKREYYRAKEDGGLLSQILLQREINITKREIKLLLGRQEYLSEKAKLLSSIEEILEMPRCPKSAILKLQKILEKY